MGSDTCTDPDLLTSPSVRQAHRIDYVFISPSLRATASGTIDTRASDHRPYFAQVGLVE